MAAVTLPSLGPSPARFRAGARPGATDTVTGILLALPDGPRPSVATGLVGRDRELEMIASFLDRTAVESEALLVSGEPGVGKTALLDAAAAAASATGRRVLRAGGVEFETPTAFSGLHQLLLPLREELEQLTGPLRKALQVALGYGPGPAPDRLMVATATLTVVRQEAAGRPVLMIVDDLPWLDEVSAGVLGLVVRRLAGNRVGFLAASRLTEESFFDRAELPQHEMAPLDEEAASRLVGLYFPELNARFRRRVLAEAQGNPLALLELCAAPRGLQPGPLAKIRNVRPQSRRLHAMFTSRITELPATARWLLLLAALDGTGDPRVLGATGAGQQELKDLAAAEQARLAYIDPSSHRLAFWHPLARTAVIEVSSGDERRRAHRVLAALLADQPEDHAWHMAEATVGLDEEVADLLEVTAYRSLRRGEVTGAAAALARAADLSPRRADCGRRLAAAAYVSVNVTGRLRAASQLLSDARRADPELRRSLPGAVAASCVLLHADGDVDTAHRLLTGAIDSHASDDTLTEALYTLLSVCSCGGRAKLWEAFHDALARLAPRPPATLRLVGAIIADPMHTTTPALEQLDASVQGLAGETDPTQIVRIAAAGAAVDRTAGCREALWRVVSDGREGGAVTSAIIALTQLSLDGFQAGEWEEADRLAAEALALCQSRGYGLMAWQVRPVQALLAAARGDHETTRSLTNEVIRWAAPRRARSPQSCAWLARSMAALGRGDFEQAYQQASAVSPAGTLASHVPFALYCPLDLVEAAARTGRHPEAAAHAKAMREAGIAALSPRLALLAAGSAAVAAPGTSALGLFEEALAIPGADRWPFDLARLQLLYGERLRRSHAMRKSRPQLAAALETFERLGASPWAVRAASELRATGFTTARPPSSIAAVQLTPQEREIAMFAAAGLTNKQIAERLFMSHRTVGAHLYRTFPKLGVTSRAALRDALGPLRPE